MASVPASGVDCTTERPAEGVKSVAPGRPPATRRRGYAEERTPTGPGSWKWEVAGEKAMGAEANRTGGTGAWRVGGAAHPPGAGRPIRNTNAVPVNPTAGEPQRSFKPRPC